MVDQHFFVDTFGRMNRDNAKSNLDKFLRSMRPDQTITAHRWIELREELSLLQAVRSLRPPRYKHRKRWVFGALLATLLIVWEVAKDQFEWVATLAIVGSLAWLFLQWLRGPIYLNSVVLFYADKATLLSDVQIDRKTGNPSCALRRDATPGSVLPKFCISALNPFWRSGNFSFVLRGQWLILSRQSGVSPRRARFQRSFAPEHEITFSEMTKRLQAYSPVSD